MAVQEMCITFVELGQIDDFAVYHRVLRYSARYDQKIILEMISIFKTIMATPVS